MLKKEMSQFVMFQSVVWESIVVKASAHFVRSDLPTTYRYLRLHSHAAILPFAISLAMIPDVHGVLRIS